MRPLLWVGAEGGSQQLGQAGGGTSTHHLHITEVTKVAGPRPVSPHCRGQGQPTFPDTRVLSSSVPPTALRSLVQECTESSEKLMSLWNLLTPWE